MKCERGQFIDLLEEKYTIPENDIGLMMGDFNGRLRSMREGLKCSLGPFGEVIRNVEER